MHKMSTSYSIDTQQQTLIKTQTIAQLARELIHKRPGIFKGNLKLWILEKMPNSTNIDIELAFLQLLKEGYFFSYEDTIHPPNTVDEHVKLLTKYISKQKLSFTDYGILYELHHLKGFRGLNKFSRKVVSKGWSEDEKEVKLRVQELLLKRVIKEHNQPLMINWELILEVIK